MRSECGSDCLLQGSLFSELPGRHIKEKYVAQIECLAQTRFYYLLLLLALV